MRCQLTKNQNSIPFDTVGYKTAGHPRPGVLLKLKDVPELSVGLPTSQTSPKRLTLLE